MADDKSFLQATDGTLSKKSMRDREVINRFAAFHLFGYRAYTNGDMDEFLAHTIGHMNSLNEEQLAKLSRKFAGSMRRNYELFGKHAFRKSLTGERERRTPINVSLFDVLSNAFSRIPDETVSSCGDRIKSCVVKLVGDDDFQYVISYSTNSTSQVIVRFEMTETVLSDYLT